MKHVKYARHWLTDKPGMQVSNAAAKAMIAKSK